MPSGLHSSYVPHLVCVFCFVIGNIYFYNRYISGYGSSSPHDQRAQAFLIFYALIGLPLNGFVLTYLGDFFSKSVNYEAFSVTQKPFL